MICSRPSTRPPWQLRAKFFDVWKKLDRKKSLRWFKATSNVRS